MIEKEDILGLAVEVLKIKFEYLVLMERIKKKLKINKIKKNAI